MPQLFVGFLPPDTFAVQPHEGLQQSQYRVVTPSVPLDSRGTVTPPGVPPVETTVVAFVVVPPVLGEPPVFGEPPVLGEPPFAVVLPVPGEPPVLGAPPVLAPVQVPQVCLQ